MFPWKGDDIYRIKLLTLRFRGPREKHAFIFNHEHGTNIAFMSLFDAPARCPVVIGSDLNEKNLYGSLMFETNFSTHNLSVGLSVNHDYLGQRANVNVSQDRQLAEDSLPLCRRCRE